MDKEYTSHFPSAKIKKVIQSNQEIGKISNTIPHLLEYALQMFLDQLLDKVNTIANEEDVHKIMPILIKKAMQKNDKFKFLEAFIEEIPEDQPQKRKRSEKGGDKESKPRKKKKGLQEQVQQNDEAENNENS